MRYVWYVLDSLFFLPNDPSIPIFEEPRPWIQKTPCRNIFKRDSTDHMTLPNNVVCVSLPSVSRRTLFLNILVAIKEGRVERMGGDCPRYASNVREGDQWLFE